jgi:hypothetical protein
MTCRPVMRSRRLQAAIPLLIDRICREINRRGMTAGDVSALYPISRQHQYHLRKAWLDGADVHVGFGPDRLIALAEALGIDTQPLLYPPEQERRAA